MYLKMSMIAVVLAWSYQSAGAALLSYEGFDYPNDSPSIVGNNGGTGWASVWLDSGDDFQRLSQDDTSLNSPAFPFTPIGDRTVASGNGAGVAASRDITPLDLAQDGVLYASFLWRKEIDGSGSADNVEFNLGGGNAKTIRIGSTSGEGFLVRFGAGGGSSTADFGSVPLAETLFTVVKITSSELSDDTMEVTFYDTSEIVPALEPATWDATATVNGGSPITSARLEYGANAHAAHDEIRFGTTWESITVIPEPTSMASLVVGFCAALACVRRRS